MPLAGPHRPSVCTLPHAVASSVQKPQALQQKPVRHAGSLVDEGAAGSQKPPSGTWRAWAGDGPSAERRETPGGVAGVRKRPSSAA